MYERKGAFQHIIGWKKTYKPIQIKVYTSGGHNNVLQLSIRLPVTCSIIN